MRSRLHGRDRNGFVALTCQHDDRDEGVFGAKQPQDLDAVSPRQRIIQQHAVGSAVVDLQQTLLAAIRLEEISRGHRILLQDAPV